jgi:hypothetical protein
MADKNWQCWINENVERGCDVHELGGILLKNGFSLPQIRAMMGEKYPESLAPSANSNVQSFAAHNNHSAAELHRKCASILEIQRDLAKLNPKARNIERRRDLSAPEFLERYYAANRPVILCDLMTLWKAPAKWTPEYLKATCGEEIVEIMAARNTNPDYEVNDARHRQKIKFADFVNMVSAGNDTNDYYLTARNEFFGRPGPKKLLKDIEIFTEYLRDTSGDGVYFWYGPKGTVTPLHHDTMNIFMAQVQGRKHVKLIPANEIDFVYNSFAVYSQVDAMRPDYGKFPKFHQATVMDLELAPGEVLFLPVGWWHWVKALDCSITISFNNFLFQNEFKWEHPKGPVRAATQ